MELSRKIEVTKCPLYQGDGGIVSFQFTAQRYYGETDLSKLSAVLKVRFSNETTDGFALEKKVENDLIRLTWNISPDQTVISGDTEGQVVFENDENTVVFNSQIFSFTIEPSIEMGFLSVSGETALEKLKRQIDEKIEEINALLNSNIVKSVNGKTNNVTITASDLSCATSEQLNNAVSEIDATYLKKTDYAKWELIKTINQAETTINVDLGGDKTKVFIVFDCYEDIDEQPRLFFSSLLTTLNGQEKYLCAGIENELLVYSAPVKMTYKLEMCGDYAKVEKVIINGNNDPSTSFLSSSTTTIGVNLNRSYINNIKLRIYDEGGDEIFVPQATVKVYAC